MLRDERGDGGRRPVLARNVLGEPLEICSFKPMTGFYRVGCCNTGREDVGSHTVCAVMTAEFLAFSKSRERNKEAWDPPWVLVLKAGLLTKEDIRRVELNVFGEKPPAQ